MCSAATSHYDGCWYDVLCVRSGIGVFMALKATRWLWACIIYFLSPCKSVLFGRIGTASYKKILLFTDRKIYLKLLHPSLSTFLMHLLCVCLSPLCSTITSNRPCHSKEIGLTRHYGYKWQTCQRILFRSQTLAGNNRKWTSNSAHSH